MSTIHSISIFVAAPSLDVIPPHSTGSAVDLALVDQNGTELNMGTGFDHFGLEAASLFLRSDQHSRKSQRDLRISRQSAPKRQITIRIFGRSY